MPGVSVPNEVKYSFLRAPTGERAYPCLEEMTG